MGQTAESEMIEAMKANPTAFIQKITHHAPEPAPLILSKKWLCVRYECVSLKSNRMNYKRLYRVVLTSSVISAIGMTEAEIRRRDMKEFDALTSARLKNVLGL